MKMKKTIAALMLLTLLSLVIAQVPAHAQNEETMPTYPGGGSALAALLTTGGDTGTPVLDPVALPALGMIYQIIHDWNVQPSMVGEGDDMFGVPPEWATISTANEFGESDSEYTLEVDLKPTGRRDEFKCPPGTVPSGVENQWGVYECIPPPEEGGAPVIPGTWRTPNDISIAWNTGPVFPAGPGQFPWTLPEFNPSVAANPINRNNVIIGQVAVDLTQLPPFALSCSLHVFDWTPPGAVVRMWLPKAPPAGAIFNFCERALVVFSADGIAYVLWTDYEIAVPLLNSRTDFDMIRSVNNGVTWTDLNGVAMGAVGFNPVVRRFPMFGLNPAGQLPVFPSLAVFGRGVGTTRLNIAYASFTTALTNEIWSISSSLGGATLPAPGTWTTAAQLAVVSPFPFGTLLLTPSNAYLPDDNGDGEPTLHVVWYDDILWPPNTIPGVGGDFFRIRERRSQDNGAIYAAATTILGLREDAPIFDPQSGLMVWPTQAPHIATDALNNMVHVIVGQGWWPGLFWWPWSAYDLVYLYNTRGNLAAPAFSTVIYPFPGPLFVEGDLFFPALTVEPTDGAVHVTYATRQDLHGNYGLPFPGWQNYFFNVVETSAEPGDLVVAGGVGAWSQLQRVSHRDANPVFMARYAVDSPFLGIFFSASASFWNVEAAWTSGSYPPWTPTIFSDNTWYNRGAKPAVVPPPVGGAVLTADTLMLLMPYLLVAVFATLGLAYALRRRFRHIALPHIPSIRS